MAPSAAESAVRNYLVSIKDPASLRDEKVIVDLQKQLEAAGDELERLRLRQAVIDAKAPSTDQFEEAFVTHAKEWAERVGVSERAFLEEGVAPQVLRRAGFRVSGRRAGRRSPRTRVSVEEVRKAIPKSAFTIKQLQERSGASPAVVRKVVQEEEKAGRLARTGTDPSHVGPGRSPTLYKQQ